MFNVFKRFGKDETGAVTVDWVVLTAAVVGLAAVLVIQLRAGSSGVTAETQNFLETRQVGEIGRASD
ncbi:hypothetical protein So717_32660 [Roseobacter cerasinus]|uniref:Pilus assembly protein n=1 Tax=Roseobacter cerasinus TaxID=2602289 RepID=A0A640VTH6_9RHOB|nr:hypothetical protein [Roseobacter cerasinus]GFE51513.1 hypothetical protein So717_32660 [Roseobacter cerasinus]